MSLKKIIFLLSLPLMLETMYACCDCDITTVKKQYRHQEVIVEHLDNSGETLFSTDEDSIIKTAYGIRALIELEVIACDQINNSLFYSSASAFSCDCPAEAEISPTDRIVNLQIITQKDFDKNTPAGTDITNKFNVYESDKFYTIEQYLTRVNKVFDKEYDLKTIVNFLLMSAPENAGKQQFEIIITLSDSRVLRKFSTEIVLK